MSKKQEKRIKQLEEENRNLKEKLNDCEHRWYLEKHVPIANYDVKIFKCVYCGETREEAERMD